MCARVCPSASHLPGAQLLNQASGGVGPGFDFDFIAAVQLARIVGSESEPARPPREDARAAPAHTHAHARVENDRSSETLQNQNGQCIAVQCQPDRSIDPRDTPLCKTGGGWVTRSVVKRTPNCLGEREERRGGHSQQPILEFVQSPTHSLTGGGRVSQSNLPADR